MRVNYFHHYNQLPITTNILKPTKPFESSRSCIRHMIYCSIITHVTRPVLKDVLIPDVKVASLLLYGTFLQYILPPFNTVFLQTECKFIEFPTLLLDVIMFPGLWKGRVVFGNVIIGLMLLFQLSNVSCIFALESLVCDSFEIFSK